MGEVQVILKKEDIRPDFLKGKIVVVFDVLFATSTMTAAIADGASSVIPVFSPDQAKKEAEKLNDSFILAGEDKGQRIEGFHPPLRTNLKEIIKNKHLILSTTNGTIALHKSRNASFLYASSLLNNPAMAEYLAEQHREENIVLVCSGSSGRYTMEDFYGAGSLIYFMQKFREWKLSDASVTALHFYSGSGEAKSLLNNCRIGRYLVKEGLNPEEIDFVAQEGLFDSILMYDHKSGQIKGG
ncbi:2-phosphosulfolactate phosphatase [Halobacillus karajensis]|uniref:Probable 2-phosphosulfolactate phosphatase n=1 Tax=Halobacillus karajensis TaxID=195088 RepID=A0A024P4Q3_9BACI|nr:2-phosphosulfolactate phosphatase [Halobacillus karajensis]CDQ20497.1 putative 2-phosphosulfolactate phosphatase [Halobacillus karajensis]CDQ24034.1 putative 2-phosphosulfolactate phosphatase [Halobacillus karajensis]CDQ27512.1 putative 2-phosphosulfolactate phosphatase [Halobacillus karajensis]SEH90855.1 2-phosphosulfolactate phosphatase [Halobacillus karajensis]